MMWLAKIIANLEKVCNQHFSLNLDLNSKNWILHTTKINIYINEYDFVKSQNM